MFKYIKEFIIILTLLTTLLVILAISYYYKQSQQSSAIIDNHEQLEAIPSINDNHQQSYERESNNENKQTYESSPRFLLERALKNEKEETIHYEEILTRTFSDLVIDIKIPKKEIEKPKILLGIKNSTINAVTEQEIGFYLQENNILPTLIPETGDDKLLCYNIDNYLLSMISNTNGHYLFLSEINEDNKSSIVLLSKSDDRVLSITPWEEKYIILFLYSQDETKTAIKIFDLATGNLPECVLMKNYNTLVVMIENLFYTNYLENKYDELILEEGSVKLIEH